MKNITEFDDTLIARLRAVVDHAVANRVTLEQFLSKNFRSDNFLLVGTVTVLYAEALRKNNGD